MEPLPAASEARDHAAESIQRLPIATRSLFDTEQKYRVEHSRELQRQSQRVAQVARPLAAK